MSIPRDPEIDLTPKLSLREAITAHASATEAVTTPEITVTQALQADKLRTVVSDRSAARLLFVTQATDCVVPGHPLQEHFVALAAQAAEVHIMVLGSGTRAMSVIRLAPNVWLYHVTAPSLRAVRRQAVRVAKEQLMFARTVRPDVTVALDPFVSGFVALKLARVLKRPWQLHVLDNPYDPEWTARQHCFEQTVKLAQYVLRRAKSVRTATTRTSTALTKRFPRLTDIAVLPRRYDLASFRQPSTMSVHEQYPSFSFIMVAEGSLRADSQLHDVISATHHLLRNPRVGLIIIGGGPGKALFQEKVALLGIERNVVFLAATVDRTSIYQTADVFIETGVDAAADERVLQAITARTAVVTYESAFRTSFLTSGISAQLCPVGDTYQLGHLVRELVNDRPLRLRLAQAAAVVVETTVHEDVTAYYQAYLASVTSVVVGE